MKIVVVILTTCLMQVSAAGFAQKLTLSKKGATLEQIFSEIRKQTGYFVVYSENKVDKTTKLDVNFRNTDLKDVLDVVSKSQNLEYSFDERNISLKPKEPSFLDKLVARFSAIDVRGTVVDAETGQALAGASVKVKGSTRATTTASNGTFYLQGVDEQDVIVVSFIGYVTQELKAKKDLREIRLVMASADLQEVTINKGFYTTTKTLNTGNVSVVSSETLKKLPVGDPLVALQGQVSGLYIEQRSGIPGASPKVQLRGRNSIANGTDPLYIVDGVPYPSASLSMGQLNSQIELNPLNNLSIPNIESISILKDADATAIYGSQGANGVIIITTKQSKTGGTKIDASIARGAGKVVNMLDIMNTEEYLQMRREAYVNDGFPLPNKNTSPGFGNYDLTLWDENSYTDWQNVIMGGTATVTDAQIRISGGTEKTNFSISSSWRKETTVLPGDNYDQKLSVQPNFSHTSSNNRFKLRLATGFGVNNDLMPSDNYMLKILLPPNTPSIYNPDGSLNWANDSWINPLAPTKMTSRAVTSNLLANGSLSYEIIPGLSIQSTFGYSLVMMKGNFIIPLTSVNPQNADPSNRSNRFGNNETKTWQLEPQLSYGRSLKFGKLDFLLGTTFRETLQDRLTQTASNFPSDLLIENIRTAATITTTSYDNVKYRYTAIYGRAGYTYDDRYVLNLTGRRDGSSRFGPGKRFGNFGALGAAWIISKEKWIKKLQPIVSFAKIRGSYGLTGNDQFSNYMYLSSYEGINYTYLTTTGLSPRRHANQDFHWETMKKLEVALELGLLDDRIQVTGGWYKNRTGNQLVGQSLPMMTGFPSVQANLPAVVQNSGIELDLKVQIAKADKLQWTAMANISFPRNKLISYPGIELSGYKSIYQVGKPLDVRFLAVYTGIEPNTGNYTYLDKNADGQITPESDYEFFSTQSKYHGGITNNLSYKGINLSIFFQFANRKGQNYLFDGTPGSMVYGNQPTEVLNRWQKPGDLNKTVQRVTTLYSPSASQVAQSDYVIGNASYVRLKNISLDYSIPSKYLKKISLSNINIYLQGQNLLTWTKFKGLDPETNSSIYTLPPIRMILAGIRIGL